MIVVYLGLGSNLGDRVANLDEAARRLAGVPGCAVLARSPLYETEPIGPPDQGWYLNAVLAVEATLTATELLAAVKHVERIMGRQPSEHWGPRLIDVDILLYDETNLATPDLTIPHPELWNRRFALIPLADLYPAGPLRDRILARLEELAATPVVRRFEASGAAEQATGAG